MGVFFNLRGMGASVDQVEPYCLAGGFCRTGMNESDERVVKS